MKQKTTNKNKFRKIHFIFGTFLIGLLFLGLSFPKAFVLAKENKTGTYVEGRVDTRYRFRGGDGNNDSDIYQYHNIASQLQPGMELYWYGGLRKDLDATKSDSDQLEKIAFTELADAGNREQNLEYRIYTAYFRYKTEQVEASLGRLFLLDYSLMTVDGGKGDLQFIKWLEWEIFAGKPWHYDYADNLRSDEIAAGTGLKTNFFDKRLKINAKYTILKEETFEYAAYEEPIISSSDGTYQMAEVNEILSNDQLIKGEIFYFHRPWLRYQGSLGLLNSELHDTKIALFGEYHPLLIDYRLHYYQQMADVHGHGNHLTQFSTFLGASKPYRKIGLWMTKSLADLFEMDGPFSDILLEAAFDNRAPTSSSDQSRFNPEYTMIRGGLIIATENKIYIHGFVDIFSTKGEKNDTTAYGGEVSKKWDKLTTGLGTAFHVYKYEATYGNSTISDKLDTREFYANVKYLPLEWLDFRLKLSMENVKVASLSEVNSDAGEAITSLYNNKNFFQIDFNVGTTF